jgi:CRISPR-associated protein Csm5
LPVWLISLDEYLIDGDELCRFDPLQALRSMTREERTRFASALDQGQLAQANEALRAAGRRLIVERIRMGRRSASELRRAIGSPAERSGDVHPFVRSNRRPYIPGSSIKGAFRTAIVSERLPRDRRPATQWTHDSALQAALELDPQDTSTDWLRFLSVADAELPEGTTLIDRPEVFHPKKPDAARMQMHYEILCGRASHPKDRTGFDITVLLDSRAPLTRAQLLQATSRFHWAIWQGERRHFFASWPETCRALDHLRASVKIKDRTMADIGPAQAPNYLLLRLGRFGHFESKSLEGVRRGHFPQARDAGRRVRQPDDWGSTRTVTRLDDGTPIPFGWVLGWVTKEETL